MVTIKDVAKLARVSPATVSNALTQRRPVSHESHQRIRAAIAELGYQPNMLARSLINRRSHTIGVVASGLEYYGPSRLVVGFDQEANELGYTLLLSLLHDPSIRDGEQTLAALSARRVDGIIWAIPEIGDNRSWITPERLKALPPVVFLSMGPRPELSVVAIDNRAGARKGTRHLIDAGRRAVGVITGPLDWWEARERLAGWRETLEAAGLDASVALTAEGDWGPASGERGIARLLEARPDLDAVFVSNDQMALGVLRIAQRTGRRVPQDLAVVGFDNIPESAFFSPPLTTVSQDLTVAGRTSVRTLHRLVEGRHEREEPGEPSAVVFEPDLIVRESSVPA